jgi:hypothetical protein
MFTRISVLVPTRGCVKELRALVDSYSVTVTDPRRAELVFRIDSDDHLSRALLQDGPWTVLVGPRLEGYRGMPLLFDDMRFAADGDVLMCGNDHMVFRTLGWPELVLAETNRYSDGIFHIGVGTFKAGNCPFSIVSRKAVQVVGKMQDPRLYWGDAYWRDVMAAFGRDVVVPTVRVDEWMDRTPDQMFKDGRQRDSHNWDRGYWEQHRKVVAEAVDKLRAAHETAA